MQRLFVYGSLRPGGSHHHLMQGLRGKWESAGLYGQLFPQGRWATRGWPAMRPDPGGAFIPGFVLTSPDLSRQWKMLDAFEGRDYRRIRCRVTLANGKRVAAWLYRQRRLPARPRSVSRLAP